MSLPTPDQFSAYFHQLHGYSPFPWQEKLAELVCTQGWPGVIDLPTASGKTACIDIALFALACAKRNPRRIFFVVDRRIIVDEAFERVRRIARALRNANEGVLGLVASRLRELAGSADAQPLHTYQLRGGIYRDQSWMRSPTQPTVVTGTVDQVGSRLLFRGYGVRDFTLPLHAAMVGNDSLILLDEAHCSRPFAQTLSRVQRYRGPQWMNNDLDAPFHFVQMTATPEGPSERARFAITDDDRANEVLGKRLTASKPAKLVAAKAKSDDADKLASTLIAEAKAIAAADTSIRRVAIMVNRVATARAVFNKLDGVPAYLLIGRMRSLDRDDVVAKLGPLKSGQPRSDPASLTFVVSTQCLEVGADLDFDALVTECASMDALLQRFGRLDRLGEFRRARACIVLPQSDPRKPDPVYGEALANTRAWLEQLASTQTELDFGLESSPTSVPQLWRALETGNKSGMTPPAPVVPALLPSHMDTLVQTSPRPVPEPEVSYFLHGCESADADVQVVWRADLDEGDRNNWAGIVELCPPTSAEPLAVRLWIFRDWMRRSEEEPIDADIEGGIPHEVSRRRRKEEAVTVLVWRDGEGTLTDLPDSIRPGDTVVIPTSYPGAEKLGYLPKVTPDDIADRAFLETRSRVQLRLHLYERLNQFVAQGDDEEGLKRALESLLDTSPDLDGWMRESLGKIVTGRIEVRSYPGDKPRIVINTLRRHVRTSGADEGVWDEDGARDERSSGDPVPLATHTANVASAVARTVEALLDPAHADAFAVAADLHDAGKADIRFQVHLRGGDELAAKYAPTLLAKGRAKPGKSPFRHELLSMTLASRVAAGPRRDLVLHLIASHHGRCRPFAPVELEPVPDAVAFNGIAFTASECNQLPAHRLDSGVPDRFWRLTRTYGWWGLAYLESMLRLSDWEASEAEQRRGSQGG